MKDQSLLRLAQCAYQMVRIQAQKPPTLRLTAPNMVAVVEKPGYSSLVF